MFREIPEALATELRSLTWRGARGLEAAEAAASVTLATTAALALHSDDPWWAAISAFQVTRAAPSMLISRGLHRIAGSIVGAIAALIALRLFVYQSLPFLLCLFLFSSLGLVGFVTSRYGYAWLIGSITACLIMLMALDQPQIAFETAVNRVAEVMIGTAASLIVCALSPAPTETAATPAPSLLDPPPLAFWRRRYGAELQRWLPANSPLLLHACRGGCTVMLIPALAQWIAPLSPVAMGVTAVAVMSIPTTAAAQADSRVVIQRGVHRLIGCLIGALIGLVVIAFFGSHFLLWMALLATGVWFCSQIQTGATGVSYVGAQAMFAYVMTMVQGLGPPISVDPGFERLASIIGGLSILLIVTLVLSLTPLSRPIGVSLPAGGD